MKRRFLCSNKTFSAMLTVLVFIFAFLTFGACNVMAADKTTSIVYYDLPTYSAVGQARQVIVRVSPDPLLGYNYLGCSLAITFPGGATELNWGSSSNGTGFVVFNVTLSEVGSHTINYFYFPGQNTTSDIYAMLNTSISQNWVVGISPDETPPTGSVVINGGAASTDDAAVSLTLSANDDLSKVRWMCFRNDGASWSNWEPYTIFTPSPVYIIDKTWNLTPGNGLKTVYVRFMDEAGQISDTYSDTITLSAPLESSSLSCSLSSTASMVGGDVIVTGYLSPAQLGESILVQGRANGGAWSTLATVSTAYDGEYSFAWPPTGIGIWEIQTSWGGDINTLPCESAALQLLVFPDTMTLLIIGGAAAAVVVGVIVFRITPSKLRSAQDILKKIAEDLSHRNYGDLLNDFDRLVNQINKAVLSGKLPREILADPYCTVENLTIIKEILAEGLANNTMEILVEETEIIPYVDGVKMVLKGFERIKDWRELASSKHSGEEIAQGVDHRLEFLLGTSRRRGESSAEFIVALISDNPIVKAFYRNVIGQRQPLVGDFWFSWMKPRAKVAEEYEPVRLRFADGKIVGARSRVHWRHLEVNGPYLDEKERVEAFFLPLFHTPIVRETAKVTNLHMILLYHVFTRCFGARVVEYEVVEGTIPPYYTERGDKPSHKPPVPYQGWYT